MNSTTWQPRLILPVQESRDHILGQQRAPVTLVEYGDYECPFCGAAQSSVEETMRRAGDDLRLVFRHFPLSTVHPHAELAAEAAEAAGVQGRFWAMHDLLFANQYHLNYQDLRVFATTLGLDLVRFDHDLGAHVHRERIHEDFMSGVRSGVNGTPCFFINGVRHNGGWDIESMMSAISRAAVLI